MRYIIEVDYKGYVFYELEDATKFALTVFKADTAKKNYDEGLTGQWKIEKHPTSIALFILDDSEIVEKKEEVIVETENLV